MKKRYLLGIVALSGLMFLTSCGKKPAEEKPVVELPKEEEALQDDEIENLGIDWFKNMETEDLDGNKLDREFFKENDLTLINVWNTQCPPCIAEIPELQKLQEKYTNIGVKGLPLEIVGYEYGVGLSEKERDQVVDILDKSQASYQQILSWEDLLATEFVYYVEGFPTTFFVDSQGEVVDIVPAARNLDQWSELVESNLEEINNEE